ncbi:hypothetical protein B7463_g9342, partial [Scytalidium lignicola]
MSQYYDESDDAQPGRQPRPLRRADSMPIRFDSPVAREIDETPAMSGAGVQNREVLRQRRPFNQSPTPEQRPRHRAYVEEEQEENEEDNPLRTIKSERERSWSPAVEIRRRPDRGRSPTGILVRERLIKTRSPSPPVLRRRVTVDSDDLDARIQRVEPPVYVANRASQDRVVDPSYEYSGRPLPSTRYPSRSRTYYDDVEDELDIRVRRERAYSPVRRLHRRPSHEDTDKVYFDPMTNSGRRGVPTPIIINNNVSNDYEDDGGRPVTSRHRSRVSRDPIPAPVINNRIFNEYHEDSRTFLRPDYIPDLSPDVISQAYTFSLSRHSNNSLGSESTLDSTSDLSEKEVSHEQERSKNEYGSGITQHILRSQYVGDGVIGGRHTVELTAMPNPNSFATKCPSPVFNWVHFEDLNMDFEQFRNNALGIGGLSDAERAAISKILGNAKRRYDKPLQTARNLKTRFMVPSFMQDYISGDRRPKTLRPRIISWLCLPYFCLEKYFVSSNLREFSHPMRTILQARFSLTGKERDMKQAICHLPATPTDHCFYIAQVWFLVLDDGGL